MKTPHIYLQEDFVEKIATQTSCGRNGWYRLMSWLSDDINFQNFMQVWESEIAANFFSANSNQPLPDMQGKLEPYFDHLYPAQFILRMAEISSREKQDWLISALNKAQQDILYSWILDSQLDREKCFIADHWLDAFDEQDMSYGGTPLYTSLTYHIFNVLGAYSKISSKKAR